MERMPWERIRDSDGIYGKKSSFADSLNYDERLLSRISVYWKRYKAMCYKKGKKVKSVLA